MRLVSQTNIQLRCKEVLLCFLVGLDAVTVVQMSEPSNLDPSADRYQSS